MTLELTKSKIREKYPDNRVEGETFDERVKIIDAEGFQMIGCTFTYKEDGDVLYLENCRNCKLEGCKFTGKNEKGNFIHFQGKDTSENHLVGCTFMNFERLSVNGGEAIIIGLDKFTGCNFNTHVTGCTFIKCNGEKELISIKSCGNVIEGNTFKQWEQGSISIRNGGFNKILNNTFIGSGGGIVVRGDGNEIKGNTHKNNDNTDVDLRPLVIENGNTSVDENFGDDGKPHGDMKTETGKYAQAKNNTIEYNTYENCKAICVVWGQEKRELHPIDNTFRSNTLIGEDVDSTFLKFHDDIGDEDEKEKVRKANTFENNNMKGDKAKRGDLPEKAAT